jgi:ADP-ribose pyrophosphatase YjhB (NUDIX family)
LVVRRGKEPAKGTLDLPGGFVDNEESGEQGMVREIKEETGLIIDTDNVKYLFSIPNTYPYSDMEIHTLDMFFICHTNGSALPQADDDAAECLWLSLHDVDVKHFGLHSIRQAVQRFLRDNC